MTEVVSKAYNKIVWFCLSKNIYILSRKKRVEVVTLRNDSYAHLSKLVIIHLLSPFKFLIFFVLFIKRNTWAP